MVLQLERAVPLKVREGEGASDGSSTEVFIMLGHALCRSNSSSKNSSLAAFLRGLGAGFAR